jgi:hypothetical protein
MGAIENSEEKSSSSDRYDNLRKLKSLLDDDVITREEYEQEKSKILAK